MRWARRNPAVAGLTAAVVLSIFGVILISSLFTLLYAVMGI